ncbi:MarR family transcriptional regulator [Streptomyces indicus]|uniref:Winged helix DNA-binding domain-containing protein n=1 Tax=Streptomyces indicus TaxID=417292 RepID=A0A1G8T7N6_9ACTN|nr:MarR family transcriptional regulator [Streptomyces indicus]SDJ37576.1 hypothetical protein SAMN05421806_101105 [Streptomyces indicus]
MTATAPLANPRDLALAHYAARGVLEQVLTGHGITFQESVTLRAAVTAGSEQTRDDLVATVQGSLKAEPAALRATVDALLAKELLAEDGGQVRPTDAGRALQQTLGAETAPVSARIWGGIPEEDLAAAGRVLALVTERANAELARLTA